MDFLRSTLSPARLAWLASAALAGLLVWLCLSLPGPDSFPVGHRTLVRHVAVYDPALASPRLDLDLLWQDGRITALAPGGTLAVDSRPPTLTIDGRGLCAVPALADAAVFLSVEGRYPENSVPAEAERSLSLQAAGGMGGVLDLNAARAFIRQARALSGPLPRVRFAGALFTAPGGWRILGQTPWDSHSVEIQEEEDLSAPWNRVLRFQDQAIFASVENEGRDELSIPLPVLCRLGSLAHERGLPFIIQTYHASKARQALAAKPDAFLGPFFDLDKASDVPQAMLDADCAYIPAMSSVLNAFPPRPLGAWLRSFPASDTVGTTALAQAEDPQGAALWLKRWTRQGVDPAKVRAVPRTLALAGVRIVFGTGSGLALVFHGLGAQTEVEHLRSAGFSPAEILRSATLNSHALARISGGRLAVGEPADVLLVKGDPTQDPALAVHPSRMFLGGVEALP